MRLRELAEEIASRQEKALIFTQFREMTAPIATFLATLFGRPGLVLHGGTPVAERKKLVDRFQHEDGPPFFVLSLKAGGSGLNLTAASHVIHLIAGGTRQWRIKQPTALFASARKKRHGTQVRLQGDGGREDRRIDLRQVRAGGRIA